MGKQEGKEFDKKNGLPKPLRRRGCERKRWDEKGGDVPRGIRNAGCWGEGGREKSGLKDVCLFLMGKDLEFREYALSHLICLLTNPQKAVLVGINIVIE